MDVVEWLRPWTFLRLPSSATIKGTPDYEARRVFGMDAASGAAVAALDVAAGDLVLDLCCCPGAKLCCIAEAAGAAGEAHGVDVSATRLSVARKLVDAFAPPGGGTPA